jgi:hypothetical protein
MRKIGEAYVNRTLVILRAGVVCDCPTIWDGVA